MVWVGGSGVIEWGTAAGITTRLAASKETVQNFCELGKFPIGVPDSIAKYYHDPEWNIHRTEKIIGRCIFWRNLNHEAPHCVYRFAEFFTTVFNISRCMINRCRKQQAALHCHWVQQIEWNLSRMQPNVEVGMQLKSQIVEYLITSVRERHCRRQGFFSERNVHTWKVP